MNSNELKMYVVSMCLCGSMISFSTLTPIMDILGMVKEGAVIEHLTISNAK